MTDTSMARQAFDRVCRDDAPMHELPHGIAWTGERLQGVTAATRDGVVRLQKGFDRRGQLRAAFLPVFFGTHAPRELAPHILRAAIGLEQEQAYVLQGVGWFESYGMWQSPQVTRTPNLLSKCGDRL